MADIYGKTKHSPAGGVTINGKFFSGGTFIPNEELERASPAEKEELERKLKLVEEVGPEQAKKISEGQEVAEQSAAIEQKKELSDIVPRQVIYIMADNKLVGKNIQPGEFIIRNNPYPDPTITPEDLKVFESLHAKRVDIIDIEANKIYSLENSDGDWPDLEVPNSFEALHSTGYIDIKEIPKEDYKILHSMVPALRAVLFPEPTTPSGLSNNPEVDLMQAPSATAPSGPPGSIQMSLNKPIYYYKTPEGRAKVWRLCNCQTDTLFSNKLYKLFSTPIVEQNAAKGGGVESDFIENNEDEVLDIHKFLKHALLDIILNNRNHTPNNIIVIRGTPMRSNFDTNLSELSEDPIPDKMEIIKSNTTYDGLTDEQLQDQKTELKLTPELIDKVLAEVNYSPAARAGIRDKLMKRYNLI